MKILSISGGQKRIYENSDGDQHDAAAVLLIDGVVVSAIEEERLSRIKHTDKFPASAIKFVLEEANITLKDIDQVCYYSISHVLNSGFADDTSKQLLQQLLFEETGHRIEKEKIYFVHHHLAHAVSSYYMSGFSESLILTIDGMGDGISGMVLKAAGKKLDVLKKISIENSLGIYYLNVIYILGYKQFDEYKVMGLAPYGNPETYRDLFKTFYKLLPDGDFAINLNQVKKSYLLIPRRGKDEDFNQAHKDIAAALQESIEEIVFHVLKHFKEKYKHTHLCLSGGVAHNCSMNGKILYSQMFENVFIQPASHDAGCALGAGLFRYYELNPGKEFKKLDHLYWGREVSEKIEMESILKKWGSFIEFKAVENVTAYAAKLIADDFVIGWVQGKSEFGPRSLGNRSILADPRPEKNKGRINSMIKSREGYRPFAPSVLEEHVGDYYDTPKGDPKYPYMIFVLKTKEDKQELLGAVTHVDGTARVQTVSRVHNEKYWDLINEFYKLTGVAIVLNTSFNNNAEPIVDSEEDAITCFLTTRLDYLVLGDFIVSKKKVELKEYERLVVKIPACNVLIQKNQFISDNEYERTYTIKNNFDNGYSCGLSKDVFHLLDACGTDISIEELLNKQEFINIDRASVIAEIIELWTKRMIILTSADKQ